MKRKIEDPTRPEGYYYGYDSAAECLAEYEADWKKQSSHAEAVVGYACFWVFIAAIVALAVVAGALNW